VSGVRGGPPPGAGARAGVGVREVLELVTGAGAAYGIVAAASPILTRLYSPADFGHFQIYVIVFSFLSIVAAWRLEVAVLLPKDDKGGVEVAVLGLTAALFTGAVTLAAWAVLSFSGMLAGRFEVLARYGWILPASVMGGGATAVLMQWALREGDRQGVSIGRVTQSSTIALTQVAAAFTPIGSAGLMVGDALGRLAGSTTLLWRGWRSHAALVREVRAADMRAMLIRYWRFPVIGSSSALVNTAGLVLPTLFLSGLGATTLGWYALVERLISVPTALVGAQISQVYGARAARLAHDNPAELRPLFLELLLKLAWTGAPPFAAVVLAGPWIFATVFGESWRVAGEYARIVAIAQYFGFFVWPVMPTLNILEHQHWQLAWDVGRLVVCAGAMAAAQSLGRSPFWVIGAYAIAMSIAYLAHAALSYTAIRWRIAEAARC